MDLIKEIEELKTGIETAKGTRRIALEARLHRLKLDAQSPTCIRRRDAETTQQERVEALFDNMPV